MFSGTVRAGEGRNAATVPFWTVDLAGRFWREGRPVVEMVRLRASSDSIFLRMAWAGTVTSAGGSVSTTLRKGMEVGGSGEEVVESLSILTETRSGGGWV